jgi:hypothetical protein
MTTIIGVRTDDQIILASDSKVTTAEDSSKDVGLFCKIGQVEGVFFGVAGLVRDSNNLFNVATTVSNAKNGSATLLDSVTKFEEMIQAPLLWAIAGIKTKSPGYYRSRMENQDVLEVAFGAVEFGKPVMYVRTFQVVRTGDAIGLNVVRTECLEGLAYIFLGSHVAINGFMVGNPGVFREGWRQGIEKLIALEAAAFPNNVSLPAHIIQITQYGPQWL